MPNFFDVIQFVSLESHHGDDLDLTPFLDYLTGNGYIVASDYMAAIELGNEIILRLGRDVAAGLRGDGAVERTSVYKENPMSVLAHLAASMGELGVTQALTYLLNQQPGLVQAFVNLLGAADIRFDPRHRVDSERGDDGGRISGRPDMKIFDAEGNLRVLVENKFWAGLTEAQPVDYLEMLREDMSSGLLFIVPGQRVEMVWKVLKARCQEAGHHVGQDAPRAGRVTWARVASRRMLVTDWKHVVDTLEGAADGQEIRSDILQFRRLTETLENIEAFPALRSDEVTNVDVARRVIAYVGLINAICNRLHEENIAGWGNAGSYSDPAMYRNLKLNNRDDDWAALLLSFYMWRDSGGITPLWLWVNPSFRLPDSFDHDGVHVPDTANKYIPIRLKLGVERETVVENAVEQIRGVLEG